MKKYYFLLFGLLFFNMLKAQIVNIPDANFKAKLLAASPSNTTAKDLAGNYFKIDSNNDGEIQVSEAQNVGSLQLIDSIILSLEGISSFTNLIDLDCSYNLITSLDVTALIKLQSLNCNHNQITSLDVTTLIDLVNFFCSNNKLTSLDVKNLDLLRYFDCSSNEISVLKLSKTIYPLSLDCGNNKISQIDLFGWLDTLYIGLNPIEELDFSNTKGLRLLWAGHSNLKSLDLGNLYELVEFNVSDCPNLEFVNIKNGKSEGLSYIQIDISRRYGFYINSGGFSNCPKLKYVCVDESQLVEVTNDYINRYFSNGSCTVGSYCSFVPGGTFYTVQGNTKLDINNNSCDVMDTNYPNLKYTISSGSFSGSVIADTTGSYSIPVQAGAHTIVPVLEVPSYYTISPASSVVSFPTQTSPFIQDFCVIANGVHPDVEIAILPILRARPGFDATYKISYKNKGNQTQSGAVNLTFDDAVLDVVATNPVVSGQSSNNLSWNFSDLKPFEAREIEIKVNVNSPMETPAVNNNDILSYTATITSTQIDETPVDNTFVLNQTVVGSFDPNDKTCLEGATIPPSAVGKYVHYLIRFENKGTAEAQNVVVKDMIDTSKFDISSLVVTQGSHPFVTKISEINKVEFIFENINLPFDDATNDGYVAFKIKTKPSLVVGDSFSNTASIYFDYNFPIVTNTATTSVLQSLGNNDFEFDSYFSVYPNPAKNSLNVDIKKQIKVSSISIYNTLGQQILVIPNAQYTKQVDVSNLKTGNYFIKLTSDKGSSVGKFIKS